MSAAAAAAAGPLPALNIMSNNASTSPARSRQTHRSRLSELLKPSPPESRTSSPKVAAALVGGKAGPPSDVPNWPFVVSAGLDGTGQSLQTGKSGNGKIEVVVGTSPVRTSHTSLPVKEPPKFSRASSTTSSAYPVQPDHTSLRHATPKVERQTHAEMEERSGLQRSASEINLPDLRGRSDTLDSQTSRPSIRSAVSETGLAEIGGATVLERPKAAASISRETKISRRQSITNRLRSRSKPVPPALGLQKDQKLAELPKAILSPREQIPDPIEERPSTLTKLARRTSWIIGSRSPSPSNRKLRQKKSIDSRPGSPSRSHHGLNGSGKLSKSVSASNISQLDGGESPAGKKSRRPLSALVTRSNSFAATTRPRLSVAPSMSAERLPISHELDDVPEMPKYIPKAKIPSSTASESPRKKDELWGAFRNLDAEFQKFSSKPSSLKAHVVRSGLLPFLKNSVDHPSTKSLRADDLDRRVNILNKWWIGLLEMLNGRNGQSVSPNDRPAILEGVAGIMTRPEWRLSLSTLAARPLSRMPKSRSASSLESSSSDFLAESVLHNVRNIFVQNLLSQMAFVVDRMSMRSVPASVVKFCGRACAYAFFFCPGVAEILVRLWSPPPDMIRRVLKEAGVLDREHDTSFAVDVLSRNFPAHLQPLAVSSYASLMRYLRGKPRDGIPLNSAYIAWNGPWVGRWAGRDSDLFFVFAKVAVSLICELLPETIGQAEWICVPGAALIQAQLLSVMDATIHRGSQHDSKEGPPPPTFDDVLGADAVVQPLPPRAPNATRIMAENRLITLLREFLFSTDLSVKPYVRYTFAHIYGNLIKAATRHVSIFNHNACFTLCDFLEEAISILNRFYKDDHDPASWIDWPFWFDVLQKMGSSNNTMTEVRLYTFLYGMWPILAKSEQRKKEICLDWLLREDFFDRQFHHWCPMVRAYYMRLLCWRVAREEGDASETNFDIFETLLRRLQKSFSWFLALQASARQNKKIPPSSAPATPAPGRRLLIVRNDSTPSNREHASWDNLVAAASSSVQPNTYQRYSSLNPLLQSAGNENSHTSAREPSPGKKGWLRKMNPFSSFAASSSPSSPETVIDDRQPRRGGNKQSDDVVSIAPSRLSTMSNSPSLLSDTPRGRSPAHAPTDRPVNIASFKFSLEWTEKPTLVPRNRKVYPPQLPRLAQQLVDIRQKLRVGMDDDRQEQDDGADNATPMMPKGNEIGISTYSGRSLVEWDMIVKECHGFYERRRTEGVTSIKWIETPTLGVENFKRPTG